MQVTLTFDPSEPEDVQAAEEAVRRLGAQLADSPAPMVVVGDRDDDVALRHAVDAVLFSKTYGENRLGYLRRVAEAGEGGVDPRELLEEHFGGNSRRFGGTHSSIERTWRSAGGLRFARQLVDENARGQHVMLPNARPVLLELLG